ncbi:hypothetical protein L2Y94_09585 [Luteibacter aegosomatis]|uniref:hypothetical protein n=1 Tax=Luteibacter aegosomatis TaxID=2911537 RepID=UPI001FFA4627|nr:hypothetical protein [Luteibacter aegosomatis]UPG87581.1 hypothetical protein L2Y94_09585 [Luteibacter aegosomatis]
MTFGKKIAHVFWLWMMRTTIALFIWTAVDIVYSIDKLRGGGLKVFNVNYTGEFTALADKSFLVNIGLGGGVALLVFGVAFWRINALKKGGLGWEGLLMVVDDLGSAILVFAVITFIYQYIHVFPHTPAEASFGWPFFLWFVAMVLYFLVKLGQDDSQQTSHNANCCCNANKNAEEGVAVDKIHVDNPV